MRTLCYFATGYVLALWVSGCASVPEHRELIASIPAVPYYPAPVAPVPPPIICHVWQPGLILFQKDSFEIRPAAKFELDNIAKAIKKSGDRVRLVGHTCDLGTSEVNLRIGLLRAEAAKRYLVGQGIAADQIEVATKGEAEPAVPNESDVRRKLNRRVETVLIPAVR